MMTFEPKPAAVTPGAYPYTFADGQERTYVQSGSVASNKDVTVVLWNISALAAAAGSTKDRVLAWLPDVSAAVGAPKAYITTDGLYVYSKGIGDQAVYTFTPFSSAIPFGDVNETWTLTINVQAATIAVSVAGEGAHAGPYTATKGTITPNVTLPTTVRVGFPPFPFSGIEAGKLDVAITVAA